MVLQIQKNTWNISTEDDDDDDDNDDAGCEKSKNDGSDEFVNKDNVNECKKQMKRKIDPITNFKYKKFKVRVDGSIKFK